MKYDLWEALEGQIKCTKGKNMNKVTVWDRKMKIYWVGLEEN